MWADEKTNGDQLPLCAMIHSPLAHNSKNWFQNPVATIFSVLISMTQSIVKGY